MKSRLYDWFKLFTFGPALAICITVAAAYWRVWSAGAESIHIFMNNHGEMKTELVLVTWIAIAMVIIIIKEFLLLREKYESEVI